VTERNFVRQLLGGGDRGIAGTIYGTVLALAALAAGAADHLGPGQDARERLLNEIFGFLMRAAHGARGPVQPVGVIAQRGGVQAPHAHARLGRARAGIQQRNIACRDHRQERSPIPGRTRNRTMVL